MKDSGLNESDRENSIKRISLRKQNEIKNLSEAFGPQIPSTLILKIDLGGYGKRSSSNFFSNSYLDLFCYILSRQKKYYPKINSRILDSNSFELMDQFDIGLAFDSGENLKVLALKDVEKMSLVEIQQGIIENLDLYESGKTIPLNRFKSTITVTDMTRLGVDLVIPTLISGQAMILSLSQSNVSELYIGCTYDHRLLEGKYVSDFLNSTRIKLENLIENSSHRKPDIICHVCEMTLAQEKNVDPSSRGFVVLKSSNNLELTICRNCFEGL